MKIINNYIFSNIIKSSFFTLANLSLIILVTQSIKYLNLMVNNGMSFNEFFYISSLLLPSLLFSITPFCLFMSIIFSLNKMVSSREIIVLKNSGLNNIQIAKPVLSVILIVFLIHYFIAIYLMPIANNKFTNFVKNLKENFITFVIQEGVFVSPTLDQTFYCEKKLDNNRFINVFYQKNQQYKVFAEEGELIKKNGEIFLKLQKGNKQFIDKDGELTVLFFDESIVKIDFNKKSHVTREKTISETNIVKLLFPDKNIYLELKNKMLAEAINRITWPIYNIILGILACITLIGSKYSRSGYFKNILKYSIIAAGIIMINFLLNSLSFKTPLFHIVQIIFIIICTIFSINKLKQETL